MNTPTTMIIVLTAIISIALLILVLRRKIAAYFEMHRLNAFFADLTLDGGKNSDDT